MNNKAVILAAGNSTRMKSEKSKLLLEICGKTVIERTVETFISSGEFTEIYLVGRECDIEEYKRIFSGVRLNYVIGGNTRQQSVKNAAYAIDGADYIAIHDGARPFVSIESIRAALKAAKTCSGAAVGVPVKDTIKIIDSEGFVETTPERDSLFAVQTPQVFRFNEYKAALAKAEKDGKDFTDDCQIMEYSGGKVKMVTGEYTNIKITTPEDIQLAENILKNL